MLAWLIDCLDRDQWSTTPTCYGLLQNGDFKIFYRLCKSKMPVQWNQLHSHHITHFISCSKNTTIRLRTIAGASYSVMEGSRFPINRVAFSPDGQMVVSCLIDRTISLGETKLPNKCTDHSKLVSRFAKYLSPLGVNTLDFTWFPEAHHGINVAALGRIIVIGHACRTICLFLLILSWREIGLSPGLSVKYLKFSFVFHYVLVLPVHSLLCSYNHWNTEEQVA